MSASRRQTRSQMREDLREIWDFLNNTMVKMTMNPVKMKK
jgi:hypothetical protein